MWFKVYPPENGIFVVYQERNLKKAIKDRKSGTFGWRILQDKMSDILNMQIGSHETARRIAAELKYYD